MTDYIRLSKNLSYLLRHGAQKEGIEITDDGWVEIPTLLRYLNRRDKVTRDDLEKVVRENNKRRFLIEGNRIRANQGHSMRVAVEMEQLTIDTVPKVVVHGTYKQFLNQILQQGLKIMGRQHIHMTTGLFKDKDVISGMRSSADVFIYIKAREAIADGIPFFRSENGVILTSGIRGVLPPKYFERVEERRGLKSILK